MKYNQTDSHVIYTKTPAKLREIKAREDIIECDGIRFLPGYANIDEIRITNVKGIPPGLKYNITRVMAGGEEYCVFLYGKATKKGVYSLEIEMDGDGSLFGVKNTVKCRMNQFKVHIL